MTATLLIIDDDVELCAMLVEYMEKEDFTVEVVHCGKEGLARGLSMEHALVILDVMLPGLNGLELLRQLRTRSNVPILLLTARGSDVDRIVGLKSALTTMCLSHSARANCLLVFAQSSGDLRISRHPLVIPNASLWGTLSWMREAGR